MRLREIVQTLHPWYRSRLSSIAIWPARETDGGGWVALLAYAPTVDAVGTEAAALTDLAKAPYRLNLPAADVGRVLEHEVRALQAFHELGNLVLLHLHLPTAAPGSMSRGNGYAAPGWLILTHAASQREREEWLRAIHTPEGWTL